MNRVIEYIIKAKDNTSTAIKSALNRMKSFASTVGRNLVNIQAGFNMLAGVAQKCWGVMQKAMAFEKMAWQFKTLIGNIDDAKVHMQMLQDMGDTPPFSLEEFARASRELMKFSDGALGFKDSLELVGDAAAALGQPVEGLASLVGRAYALIRDGQPIQRAGMMLRNVGAITPEVVQRLNDMQAAGATNIELWNELTKELGRFKGAMADTEKTVDGMVGAIGAQWDDAVRSFGDAFMEVSKDGVGSLLEKMKELNEDGTVELWAEKIADACASIVESFKTVAPALGAVWDGIKMTFLSVGKEIGNFAGAVSMGEFGAAFGNFGKGIAEAYEEVYDPDGTQARNEAERKDEIKNRKVLAKEEKRRKAEEMAIEKRAKMEEDMAKKQAEKEAADAEKLYQEQLEEYYKLLDEEEAARRKMQEDLAREELEAERKRHQLAISNAQAEVQESEKMESEAQTRLQAAQNQVQKAWGWYRNKDTMQAEIDNYKEQKAAEEQFVKDFEKLKSKRRDWRDIEFGKLSVEEEATRQVALAKEEEKAAQEALVEIQENTAYLKEIAEALTNTEES